MHVLLAAIIILAMQNAVADQQSVITNQQCVPTVGVVYRSLPNASQEQVRIFLSAFGSSECDNNVEFGEFGNEVMWHLIEKQPELFFSELFLANASALKRISWEIENPIHDGINVIRRYNAVKDAKLSPELEKRALTLLRPARDAEEKKIREWEIKNNLKWEYPKSD